MSRKSTRKKGVDIYEDGSFLLVRQLSLGLDYSSVRGAQKKTQTTPLFLAAELFLWRTETSAAKKNILRGTKRT